MKEDLLAKSQSSYLAQYLMILHTSEASFNFGKFDYRYSEFDKIQYFKQKLKKAMI